MARPKLSKPQKIQNRQKMERILPQLRLFCHVRINVEYHWTLMFRNGRRIEVYPSNFGFHNVGRKLRYFADQSALLAEAKRFSEMPPLPKSPELIENE